MKTNQNVVYGKRMKKSDILFSILAIYLITFTIFKLVFMYAKSIGYVDGIVNSILFEPILALCLTPLLALLILSIHKCKYLELTSTNIIYNEGESFLESLKLVLSILKNSDYKKAYKTISYSEIKNLTLSYSAGNMSSNTNFDTYYLSIKLFNKNHCFLEISQSMVLNDTFNSAFIHKVIEGLKKHDVDIKDHYQIIPLLNENQKTLYQHLNNVTKSQLK